MSTFLAVGELTISAGAAITYDSSSSQFVAYASMYGKKVGYNTGASWQVTDTFTPSDVALIVSSKSTDCTSVIDFADASAEITLTTGLNLNKGSVGWGSDTMSQPDFAFNSEYRYKMYEHVVSSDNTAKMAPTPWFSCQYGSVTIPSTIKDRTLYITGASDQQITIASLTVSNGQNGERCRDKIPILSQSILSGKWSDGSTSGATETDLNYSNAHKVSAASDCVALSILDAKECSAYKVYGKLASPSFTQNSNLIEYKITVPGLNVARNGLVIKLTTLQIAFD